MILIVDDDASVRRLVELRLSSRGFPTRCAGSAKEAMQILHSGVRPCLMLVDVMMPGETGWEFSKRLLQEPLLAGIPIKFMSASHVAIEKYLKAGDSRVSLLPKPLDASRLLAAAEAHCKCRRIGARS
jgi:CheY-like chemotaxis protein